MITTPNIDVVGGLAPVAKGSQSPRASERAAPAQTAPAEVEPLILQPDRVAVSEAALAQQGQGIEAAVRPNPQDQVAEQLQELIQSLRRNVTTVQFNVTQQNGQVIIEVVNKETGEIVREIPSDEIRHLRQALEDIRGLLLDEIS